MSQKVRIYTKTGDKGETSIFGGQRLKKYDQRIWAIGTVDELNGLLGVVISFEKDKKVSALLEQIQNDLFEIGAELADPNKAGNFFALATEKVTFLEKTIDTFDEKLKPIQNFILPGGTHEASFLHLARSVCRRAEREIVTLAENTNLNENLVKYLNRLSDLLFTMARVENKKAKKADKIWKKE